MTPDTFIDLTGIWVAALLTFCVFSFLIKDNFMFKLTEAIFVGVSVGYFIVLTYQNGIKPKIEKPLIKYVHNLKVDKSAVTNTIVAEINSFVSSHKPTNDLQLAAVEQTPFNENGFFILMNETLGRSSLDLADQKQVATAVQNALNNSTLNMKNIFELEKSTGKYVKSYKTVSLSRNLWVAYIIFSLLLGLLFLSRFSPKHAWVSRYPMAYLLGIGVGMAMPLNFQTQILGQIQASIIPVVHSVSGSIDWAKTFGNISLIVGILSVLYYFFFSLKKTDPFSRGLTKIGIAYLMIGFGASFAFTIMARVSLLIGRVTFLKEEWIMGTIRYFGY